MEIIRKIADMEMYVRPEGRLKPLLQPFRGAKGKIGFVPTMGALHRGHLSLIDIAKKKADFIVVSIFVNPLQFGQGEDFEAYPRNLEQDAKLLQEQGVDVLFAPDSKEMYPSEYFTYIEVPELSSVLCGRSRPLHFRGVCTIVCKLFNIIKPAIAVFGEKDAQQAIIIKKMVEDLNLGVKIITGKTIREQDGLAISSRNAYLTKEEREEAPVIYQALKSAKNIIAQGERDVNKIRNTIKDIILSRSRFIGTKIDYIEIVRKSDLKPVGAGFTRDYRGEILIAVAVKFSKARLIDNITVGSRE